MSSPAWIFSLENGSSGKSPGDEFDFSLLGSPVLHKLFWGFSRACISDGIGLECSWDSIPNGASLPYTAHVAGLGYI